MNNSVKKVLRFFLAPCRWWNARQNGVLDTSQRHEIPNDVLLGLVRDTIRQGGTDENGNPIAHHTAIIWVKGYSMRPFLEHMRDKVQLAYPSRPLVVGDAVLAEITPGHYVLHRIIEIKGDEITLMGDGNLQGTEHCHTKDVAGIVTHYIRPKRTLLADDPQLNRRIRRWRKLLPVRRFLLLIYRTTV